MKKRAALHNLGCKVNEFETEAMRELLEKAGYEIVPFEPGADVYVINTCTVTNIADRKSRQMLHKARKMNPAAIVAAAGCYAQTDAQSLEKDDAVDLIIGNNRKKDIAVILEEFERSRVRKTEVPEIGKAREFEPLSLERTTERVRAFVKVQDGCNQFCSYCIIPYARGRVLSLSREKCAAAAAELAGQGYREIVVTGIEIASWGKDLKNGQTLIDAIEAMAAAAPEVRLHLGSLEPTAVTEKFVERLSRLNVCPHFHLSLQSGCDATLRRMRRKYDTAAFLAVTERLRAAFPGCALTTDLITGFPGETEEEFAATLALLEKCAFSAVHVFPYSLRPGTKAAEMPDQVEKAEKARRVRRAKAAAERTGRAYRAGCVGRTLSVLFETETEGECVGHAENYVPVAVPGTGLRGLVKKVKITGVRGEMLVGVVL